MSLYPAGFQYGTAKPAPKGPATTAGKKAAPTLTLTQQIAQMAGAPVYYSGSRRQAYADAKAQTASTVAGFHALQAEQLRQAHNQAQQMLAASRAAAQFESGLGNATAQDYQQAGTQQQQLASGFTGQLRDDAQAEADATAAKIAAAGGSAPAANQAGSLANLLYGLSAVVPQNVLASQALGAIAAARAVPGQSLALGQQSAFGALGQGQQAAAQFNPEITKALTGQAGLASTLAHQYEQDARQAHQDQVGNLFHIGSLAQGDARLANDQASAAALAKYRDAEIANRQDATAALAAYRDRVQVHGSPYSGLYSVDPKTGKTTIISQPLSSTQPVLRSVGNGGLVSVNPDGTVTTIRQPDAAPPTIRSTPGGGIVQVNPDGSITTLRKPNPPAASTSRSSSSRRIIFDHAQKIAQLGFAPKASGVSFDTPEPKPYADVFRQVRAYLLGAGVAKKDVNSQARQAMAAVGYGPLAPDSPSNPANVAKGVASAFGLGGGSAGSGFNISLG